VSKVARPSQKWSVYCLNLVESNVSLKRFILGFYMRADEFLYLDTRMRTHPYAKFNIIDSSTRKRLWIIVDFGWRDNRMKIYIYTLSEREIYIYIYNRIKDTYIHYLKFRLHFFFIPKRLKICFSIFSFSVSSTSKLISTDKPNVRRS